MWRLSVHERRLSAARRRLQRQIDSGAGTPGACDEEQRVSAERRQLHELIGVLGGRFERS